MLRFMALRHCRPAAALLVAAAIAMQAFLAGLAAAEGARAATPGAADFAIICHGGGAADPGNGTPPEPTGAKHPCCLSCTAAAPILGGPPSVPLPRRGRSLAAAAPDTGANVIARRAVRAGLSQAPPSQI
jgi:hypothetical protein